MALRDQPYLPLFVQDFLTDEKLAECSAATTGVYIRLMCIMHKGEEYGKFLLKQKSKQNYFLLSDFASRLQKQMPYSVEEIASALDELIFYGVIQQEGDRILQKRMVRDNSLSEIRSKAGKKGGEKTGICLSKMASKTQANTEYEIEYTNENEIEEEIGSQEGKFLAFWDSYPCHMDQIKAEVEFSKLNPSVELFETILASLEKWKKCDRWTEESGKFIPYPSTWLKDKRWRDDVPTPTVKKADKPKQNFEGVTYTDEQLKEFEVDPDEYLKRLQNKKRAKEEEQHLEKVKEPART